MRQLFCFAMLVIGTGANVSAGILISGDLISSGDITIIGDVEILNPNITLQTGLGAGDDLHVITGQWDGNDGLSMLAGDGTIRFDVTGVYNSTATTLLDAQFLIFNIDEAILNLLGDIDSPNAQINGMGGDDIFNLQLDDDSPIQLTGGAGVDVLNLSGGGLVTFTGPDAGFITKAGFAPITFTGIETIQGSNLQFQTVPEPGLTTAAMLLFGLALPLRRRRNARISR